MRCCTISKCAIAPTCGKDGSELYRDGELFAAANAPAVDAIDATGAGDAFTAALVVAFAEEMSPVEALRFACAAGALATTCRGAQPSLPRRAAVDSLVSPLP